MIFWIAECRHLSAVGSYNVTLGPPGGRGISSLRVNVGLQSEQEFFDGWLTEDRYESHGFESRHDLCAFRRLQDRPACSFLNRDLFIGVDADDQHVTEFSRAGKVTDVSDVKHVETSVG